MVGTKEREVVRPRVAAWKVIVLFNSVAGILLVGLRFLHPEGLLFEQILLTGGGLALVTYVVYWVVASRGVHLAMEPLRGSSPMGLVLLCGFLIYMQVFGTVLLNVDRSRSLHVFKWVATSGSPVSEEQLRQHIEQRGGYVDWPAVELRISEQVQRGFIMENEGSFALSPVGSVVNQVASVSARIFNLQGWDEA